MTKYFKTKNLAILLLLLSFFFPKITEATPPSAPIEVKINFQTVKSSVNFLPLELEFTPWEGTENYSRTRVKFSLIRKYGEPEPEEEVIKEFLIKTEPFLTYKYRVVIKGVSEGLIEVRAGAILESVDTEGKVSSYAGKTPPLYVAVNNQGQIEKVEKEMLTNWPSYLPKGEVVRLEEIKPIGVFKEEIKKSPHGLFEVIRQNRYYSFLFLVGFGLSVGIIGIIILSLLIRRVMRRK